MRNGLIIGLVAVLNSCAGERTDGNSTDKPSQAREIGAEYPFYPLQPRGSDRWEPEYFVLPVNGGEYRVMLGPRSEVIDRTLVIEAEDGWFINRALAAQYEDDLLVVVETEGGGYGSSAMTRLGLDPVRLIWTAVIGTFNTANPAVRGGAVYVSGLGLIQKIDVSSGETLWRHSDLWEHGQFNSFEPAQFSGDTVLIAESGPRGRVIRVLDSSGKRIDQFE